MKLTERIAERKQENPGKRNIHLAGIVAQKEEIIEALADGWTLKDIHETLENEGVFTGTYQAFRRTLIKAGITYRQKERQNKESLPVASAIKSNEPPSSAAPAALPSIGAEETKTPTIAKISKKTFSYDKNKK